MSIQGLATLFISASVFSFIFSRLNQYNSKIFSIFDKIPASWKGKWYIKWIFILLLFIIVATIGVYGEIGDITGYFIAGFVFSLCDFAFKKSQENL